MAARADVSGFDIGSGSDLTWNFYAVGRYVVSQRFSFAAGYRILDIDYSSGSGANEFGMDVQMHGPYLGGTLRF